MKEILEKVKLKYLSFDKSKSNKNFILGQNSLALDNLNNNNNIFNRNLNIINSNDFSQIENSEKYLTNRTNKNSFFNKTSSNLKFSDIYNNSMKKIFKKRIRSKLPDLKSITNSSNLIIQNIRRHVLFTEETYPFSLNDNEYGYKTLKSKEKKDILKEKKCILEQIDNEEYMSKIKSSFNEELINKEKISFNDKQNYDNIITLLIKKIKFSKFENNSCLSKEFFVKRDYKKYLAGKLSINSILIKIVDIGNFLEKYIFLPFFIIPFFLSISRNDFYFFISKILSINKENNLGGNNNIFKIIIDESKIIKYSKLIASNNQLFDNNSILFDNKILKEEIFYLFINNKTYSIAIIPPFIELSKNEEKIKIKKILSKGLWLSLFQNNYNDWETICLIYLYSFHDFRQIQYSTIKFNSEQIIDLNIDETNIKNNYIPIIKDIDKKIIFYIYNNELLKDENKFLLLTFYCYSIDQIYDKQQYKLFLNLEQTKILLNLNIENFKLLPILYKCSLENEEHKGINLNFPLIKSYKMAKINNYFNQNYKYNIQFNNKKHSKSYKYKYKYKKGLNIKLNLPFIEIKEINDSKITKKNFEIKEEILNKMIEVNYEGLLKEIGKSVINNIIDNLSNITGEKKEMILRTQTLKNVQLKGISLYFRIVFIHKILV